MTTPKADSTFSTFPENRTTELEGNMGTSGKLGRTRPRGGDHRPMRFTGYIIL